MEVCGKANQRRGVNFSHLTGWLRNGRVPNAAPPTWLSLDWLSYFGRTRRASQQEYRRQINQALGWVVPSPWDALRQGLVLGGRLALESGPRTPGPTRRPRSDPLASACGRGRGVASHRLAGGAGVRPSRGHLAACPCGRPADDGTCQGVRLPRRQRDPSRRPPPGGSGQGRSRSRPSPAATRRQGVKCQELTPCPTLPAPSAAHYPQPVHPLARAVSLPGEPDVGNPQVQFCEGR
jgi:hypothetical protein